MALPSAGAGRRGPRIRARALVLLALAFLLSATTVGLGWDRSWHATRPFVSFLSPPHLFIYGMIALTALCIGGIAATRELRAQFGAAAPVPRLRLVLPPALMLAAGALTLVLVAGILDAFWHTTFGLDETAWSLPHAMIGTGLALSYLGLLSCLLQLRGRRLPATPVAIALGILALLFTIRVGIGPLDQPSQELARRIARLPIFVIQPAIAHSFRISAVWQLDRSHPAFAPLAALTGGLALRLLWSLAPRPRPLLAGAAIATVLLAYEPWGVARYFGLASDVRAWLPVPLLPAAIAIALTRQWPAPTSWMAGGLTFALLTALLWNPSAAVFAISTLAFGAGSLAGEGLWRTVSRPTRRSVAIALGAYGAALPLITGAVDLYLRTHTP